MRLPREALGEGAGAILLNARPGTKHSVPFPVPFVSLLCVGVATISVNVAANVVSPANDFASSTSPACGCGHRGGPGGAAAAAP